MTSVGVEVDVFLNLWGETIFRPLNIKRSGQLFYRISNERYEEMITTHYSPKPKKEVRALYVLIDYPQE